ncbi:MAG: hypothetical protein ACYCQJ_09440 [Nitrososphaerales archaeon]
MSEASQEIILAEEQDVIYKPTHLGLKDSLEGTIVLTNKRLIFACGSEKIEEFSNQATKNEPLEEKVSKESANLGMDLVGGNAPLTYSDVQDLKSIPPSEKNLFVPISSIQQIKGHSGFIGRPNLKVRWQGEGKEYETEFQQILTSSERKKKLSDWAGVIQKLKSGSLFIQSLPALPSTDTLEGKISYVMGDMQTKGTLEIEQEVEARFKVDLEPDDVERACAELASQKILDVIDDGSGDLFYKKRSPLGEDDLSS